MSKNFFSLNSTILNGFLANSNSGTLKRKKLALFQKKSDFSEFFFVFFGRQKQKFQKWPDKLFVLLLCSLTQKSREK
jgi:hypothetical protein